MCRQELENPLILIHEKKISDMNLLVRVLELAVKVIKFFHLSLFHVMQYNIGPQAIFIDFFWCFLLLIESKAAPDCC